MRPRFNITKCLPHRSWRGANINFGLNFGSENNRVPLYLKMGRGLARMNADFYFCDKLNPRLSAQIRVQIMPS